MTTRISTDRSRILDYQSCPRRRFLAYHEGPQALGIVSLRKPLPLAVGGSVHEGLATLLQVGQTLATAFPNAWDRAEWGHLEDNAVTVALADFSTYAGHLELDITESSTMSPSASLSDTLAASLGMSPEDAGLGDLTERVGKSRSEFDEFLYAEQSALVEALVRAYARRRLRPLLEQFEVLEVEREGEWLLTELEGGLNQAGSVFGACTNRECRALFTRADLDRGVCYNCGQNISELAPKEIWFMSRPDALLLERTSRDLYILSFKTTATWDIRKARDAEHDMQGLSEGVEVERRLAEWWEQLHSARAISASIDPIEGRTQRMVDYLIGCQAPPRIHAIRYEYMLKGSRRKDKDLTARLSLDCQSQDSPLVRAYLSAGMASGDEQWNWSWQYLKEGGETSNLYWKAWRKTPIWEHMPIRKWIDMLDAAVETVGTEGQSRGWTGPAQATGGTSEHPLDSIFLPPIVIYRNDDDLRDWFEQTEAQERRVAEGVALVRAATDEGERRHLLNLHFEQYRKSCEYPSTCQFVRVCYGGEDIRRDPLGSGLYQIRQPNHPQEVKS